MYKGRQYGNSYRKDMHKIFYGAAIVLSLLMVTPASAATLTASQQTELSVAISSLSQLLATVQARLNQGTLTAADRANLSVTLGGMSNLLASLRLALSSPRTSNVASAPSRNPVAVSTPAPAAEAQPDSNVNAQSAVPEDTAPATTQNENPGLVATESENTGNLFTSPAFWITLGVIALVVLGLWSLARTTPRTRTAYAAKRDEEKFLK